MLKVGISGGLASGKSLFSETWSDLGAHVLYADLLAKQLMIDDQGLKKKIIKTFGEDSYKENGDLNRIFLAQQAFESGRVEKLNAIVHPEVQQHLQKDISEASKNGFEIYLYEAALLLKDGRPPIFDIIVWIEADKSTRIERAKKRNNWTVKEAEKRLHYQQELAEVNQWVDYVIYNNQDKEAFISQATQLFNELNPAYN